MIIAVLTISTLIAAIPMASAEITSDPFLVEKGGTTALTNGPVGTKVDVVGNATSGAADAFAVVTIYWDSLAGEVMGTGTADNTGAYRISVTIPASVAGAHWIIANDGETESGGTQFTVEPALSVSPDYALPGDTVMVSGDGYADDSDITLFLNQTTDPTISFVITVPAITTDDNGSFDASVVVPDVDFADFDVYDVNATDEDTNTAVAQLEIDYYINCVPPAGPTGITTTISGRIAADVAYTITFNAASIATGTTASDGSYSFAYTIPGVLSPAAYTVTITWETVNTRSTTFTVTPAPTISLGALNGVAGSVITISGSGFSGNANITLYFDTTVVNSTAMDANFTHTTKGGDLAAGLTFVVPTLTPGVYAVWVTDQYGATSASGVYFTINPTPVTTVELRGTMYYPMDTLSFNIWTTEASLGLITVSVYDPSDMLWWRTDDWELTDFVVYKTVIFQEQGADDYNQLHITLPADAPVGSWNWTITYTPASTGTLTKSTGLFIVEPRPSMDMIMDELTVFLEELNASIIAIDDAIASIEIPELGTITASLSSLDSKITSISGDMATVETCCGTVQTTVESLDVVVGSLYGDVVTLQTAVGAVQTSVDNLDATVTSIEDGVVTIDTNFGTLEGTITDMESGLATVQTDVGTLKVDVADVKSNVGSVKTTVDDSLPVTVDMMPVWIAVILSLIAAIAAIFAVITIRQKIAG